MPPLEGAGGPLRLRLFEGCGDGAIEGFGVPDGAEVGASDGNGLHKVGRETCDS